MQFVHSMSPEEATPEEVNQVITMLEQHKDEIHKQAFAVLTLLDEQKKALDTELARWKPPAPPSGWRRILFFFGRS